MKEVNTRDVAEPRARKRDRSYTVVWSADGKQKKTFEHLTIARQFAREKIGMDVHITNKNGVNLPL